MHPTATSRLCIQLFYLIYLFPLTHVSVLESVKVNLLGLLVIPRAFSNADVVFAIATYSGSQITSLAW